MTFLSARLTTVMNCSPFPPDFAADEKEYVHTKDEGDFGKRAYRRLSFEGFYLTEIALSEPSLLGQFIEREAFISVLST